MGAMLSPILRIMPLVALAACAAQAKTPPTIALLPLDDRPVCTQMPRLMAGIAGSNVILPPMDALGRFTRPGDCERLAEWLKTVAGQVDALVVSTDMLCYGGLVASRDNEVTEAQARERLQILESIRQERPTLPVYVFSGIMRAAPTATLRSNKWRLDLAEYLTLSDKASVTGSDKAAKEARQHRRHVPPAELKKYLATRERDHNIQVLLVGMLKRGVVDYVVFGQDDAEQYGPHRAERANLKTHLSSAGVAGKAMLCGGIDQTACILVARHLVKLEARSPRIWVEWAGESGRHIRPPNEGQSVDAAVWAQVYSVGARPASSNESADVVLFVNTYKRTADEFAEFKDKMAKQVDEGRMVGLADLNLGAGGKADGLLLRHLLEDRIGVRLASYAGWNTASNTLGTAIPHAILYWLARQNPAVDAKACAIAQREFLLLRFASEYGYHNYIRPLANDYLTNDLKGNKDELTEEQHLKLERFVSKHSLKMLTSFFDLGFKGASISVGRSGETEVIAELTNVSIGLPWPRAYEVTMSFYLKTAPAANGITGP